jgi:tetratricopeptide (TPR) repeat protein
MARLSDPFREFPKAIEAEFQRGLDHMYQADAPQPAIVVFEEILERFPDLAVVHAALGLCFQRIEDSGRAMDSFRRALELAPEDARNHLYVADLYFARERFDQAERGYRDVIERDPLSDHAYERLGHIALQRGDAEEAARWLGRVATLRPEDAAARLSYGRALLARGELDQAQAQFSAVLEKDARNVEALLRLGMVHLEQQKRQHDPERARALGEQAARCFEQVLDLQPQNAFAARMLKSLKP